MLQFIQHVVVGLVVLCAEFTCCQCTKLIHFLTCTGIHCRDSHCENGLVRWCLYKNNCHPRVMSHFLPHLTLTTSTSSLSTTSPFFPTMSPTHTRPLVHDEYLPCDVPRKSGGSTLIPSLTKGRTFQVARLRSPEERQTRKGVTRER